MAKRQLELPLEVATELAGTNDAVLRKLADNLQCKIFLRGNILTLDGDESAIENAEVVIRELSDLIARGHEIGPSSIQSIARIIDQQESPATVLEFTTMQLSLLAHIGRRRYWGDAGVVCGHKSSLTIHLASLIKSLFAVCREHPR